MIGCKECNFRSTYTCLAVVLTRSDRILVNTSGVVLARLEARNVECSDNCRAPFENAAVRCLLGNSGSGAGPMDAERSRSAFESALALGVGSLKTRMDSVVTPFVTQKQLVKSLTNLDASREVRSRLPKGHRLHKRNESLSDKCIR